MNELLERRDLIVKPLLSEEEIKVMLRKRNRTLTLSRCWLLVLLLGSSFVAGCAVHYYDTETGTEHVWGIGYMKMKATKPNEGIQMVVHGTDGVGLSVGKADKQTYFTLGWHRIETIDILAENVSVRLEWPNSSFFNVRVGSEFPSEPRFAQGSGSQEPISDTKDKESRP